MNVVQKSDAIKAGLRKGFQDGSSKVACCKCCGDTLSPNGELEITKRSKSGMLIFERYLSLAIVWGELLIEKQGILSPLQGDLK